MRARLPGTLLIIVLTLAVVWAIYLAFSGVVR